MMQKLSLIGWKTVSFWTSKKRRQNSSFFLLENQINNLLSKNWDRPQHHSSAWFLWISWCDTRHSSQHFRPSQKGSETYKISRELAPKDSPQSLTDRSRHNYHLHREYNEWAHHQRNLPTTKGVFLLWEVLLGEITGKLFPGKGCIIME